MWGCWGVSRTKLLLQAMERCSGATEDWSAGRACNTTVVVSGTYFDRLSEDPTDGNPRLAFQCKMEPATTAPTIATAPTTTPTTTIFWIHGGRSETGGGLLPKPSIFLRGTALLVVVARGGCKSVGSGRLSMRATNTRWYNSAAGESYLVRIAESDDNEETGVGSPPRLVVVVLGIDTP